jgi:hypothetical protein
MSWQFEDDDEDERAKCGNKWKEGSAVVRPMHSVMELAGSLKSEVPFTSIGEETEAATAA